MSGVLSIDVGIVNLAVCLLNGPDNIEFWHVFDLGKAADTTRRLIKLNSALEGVPELRDKSKIKTVLIEKQPSFNPKMRVMASALHMYFVTKGFKDIRSYSAKYKLQLCEGADAYNCATRYSNNKKRAVETTKHFLDNVSSLNKWTATFSDAKKKDDYADSFLQGVSFYKIYKSETQEMKKPTKKTLASGVLEESHFSWLWNLWNQEHARVLAGSVDRPPSGPMDHFLNINIEDQTYSIKKHIETVANKNVMKQLLAEYSSIDDFVENFSQ